MTDLENKAFAFLQVHTLYDECKGKHYRDKSDFELMAEFAQKQTDNLSKHIIDLQKDKGNLTDRCKELEQQIEKMKSDVKQGLSYWNSCDMQYDLYQRLLDKWEIKEK